jgi:hypothetical protein
MKATQTGLSVAMSRRPRGVEQLGNLCVMIETQKQKQQRLFYLVSEFPGLPAHVPKKRLRSISTW